MRPTTARCSVDVVLNMPDDELTCAGSVMLKYLMLILPVAYNVIWNEYRGNGAALIAPYATALYGTFSNLIDIY